MYEYVSVIDRSVGRGIEMGMVMGIEIGMEMYARDECV